MRFAAIRGRLVFRCLGVQVFRCSGFHRSGVGGLMGDGWRGNGSLAYYLFNDWTSELK